MVYKLPDHAVADRIEKLYAQVCDGTGGAAVKKQLVRHLKNDVTFPDDLVETIIAYEKVLAHSALDLDADFARDWPRYSTPDREGFLYLVNEAGNAFLRNNGYDPIDIAFEEIESDREGYETYGEHQEERHLSRLSPLSLEKGGVFAVANMGHEGFHAIIKQYGARHPDIAAKSSGLRWSVVEAFAGNAIDIYDACAEENIVCSAQVQLAEDLAPNSNAAAAIRKTHLEDHGHQHAAASKQFFRLARK